MEDGHVAGGAGELGERVALFDQAGDEVAAALHAVWVQALWVGGQQAGYRGDGIRGDAGAAAAGAHIGEEGHHQEALLWGIEEVAEVPAVLVPDAAVGCRGLPSQVHAA